MHGSAGVPLEFLSLISLVWNRITLAGTLGFAYLSDPHQDNYSRFYFSRKHQQGSISKVTFHLKPLANFLITDSCFLCHISSKLLPVVCPRILDFSWKTNHPDCFWFICFTEVKLETNSQLKPRWWNETEIKEMQKNDK